MADLTPVAFDIETSGLDDDAVITVAGLAHELGEFLVLNTGGRDADQERLTRALVPHSNGTDPDLRITHSEQQLLEVLSEIAHARLDDDRHYLTAYHGETWNGGFDLPFVRTACVTHDLEWPFSESSVCRYAGCS